MELRTNVRAVVKCAIADPRYAWELRDSGLKAALTGTNSADWQGSPRSATSPEELRALRGSDMNRG